MPYWFSHKRLTINIRFFNDKIMTFIFTLEVNVFKKTETNEMKTYFFFKSKIILHMKAPLSQQTENQYSQPKNILYFLVLILLWIPCNAFSMILNKIHWMSQNFQRNNMNS